MAAFKRKKLEEWDYKITKWMYTYGKLLLRFSLAIIFIWFGYLKIIEASPAQELVLKTSFLLEPYTFLHVLGVWEVLIGIFMCFRRTVRIALILMIFQMPGTFLPLFLFPEISFVDAPLKLTMEGQYIVKNIIILSAAIVAGSTVREREFVAKNIQPAETP